MTHVRPMTALDAELREQATALGRIYGHTRDAERLAVMQALMDQVERGTRYDGVPPRHVLIRLAAHSLAWVESRE